MSGGIASWHQLVLLRDGHSHAPSVQGRRLVGVRALPVWARAEDRVELSLRALADEVGEAVSGFHREEGQAWFDHEPVAVPVMVLLHYSQHVVAVMLDDRIHVAAAVTEDGLAGRQRFRVLSDLAAGLRRAGFSTLVDHDSGVTIAASDAALAHRLGVAEDERAAHESWLDVRAGAAIGAAAGVVLGLSIVLRNQPSLLVSVAVVAAASLWTAIFAAGYAWWHQRSERATHLRRFRSSLLPQHVESRTQHFVADPGWWQEVATALVFGGMLWISLATGEYLAAVAFVLLLTAAFGYSLAVRAAHVEIDASGLTGLTIRGRRRIDFRDIDWISSTVDPEPRVVQSLEVGRIWIPRPVDEGEHLLERLWTDARAAASGVDAIPRDDVARQAALVDDVRRNVAAVRAGGGGGGIGGHGAWRPLWLRLVRPHPLRPQFAWQRHLLERGHVVLAHVTGANQFLLISGASHQPVDVSSRVVFSTNQAWRDGAAVSERIAACEERLWAQLRRESGEADDGNHGEDGETRPHEPLSGDLLAFAQALRRNAGHPLMVPVPVALGGGRGVFCTSLIVVRRHLPLGSLESWWLPLLVDPGICPYAMVVPLRHWPRTVRRIWKDGPAPEPTEPTEPAERAPTP